MKLKRFTPILLSTMLLASCALLPTGKQGGNSSTSGNITSNTSGSGTGSSSSSLSSEEGDPKVTSVTISETAKNMKPGALATLTATVNGDAGIDKTVTWASSNTSVAAVSNGTVTVASGATSGNKATITATSNQDSSKKASCEITVVASEYTIMMYICGADLESDNSFATSDINEILSVSGQPDSVNIIIETGGASQWHISSIDSTKLCRFEIRNKQLNLVEKISNASMGQSSTLRSFLNWGLTNYPASHTALIYWNHGGAASGCCLDENYSNDPLLPHESTEAYVDTISSKLDWVGYDCCSMQYADLASINSDYFHYMVASQELEAGEGWDYDVWLPTLFSNTSVSTSTLLDKICDSFVKDNGGTSSSNDQCLSALNLDNMPALSSAIETFATTLKSSDWSKFESIGDVALQLGTQYHSGDYYFGTYDMKSFLTYAKQSTYGGFSVDSILTALSNVVSSTYAGGYYGSTKPCGLNLFVPTGGYYFEISKSHYGANDTKLTNWRNYVIANGSFAGGYGY